MHVASSILPYGPKRHWWALRRGFQVAAQVDTCVGLWSGARDDVFRAEAHGMIAVLVRGMGNSETEIPRPNRSATNVILLIREALD